MVRDDTPSGTVSQNYSEWRQNWLLAKLDLFAALLKLRLRKSPAELWSVAFKTENDEKDQATVDVSLFDNIEDEKLISKCQSIFDWLKDELGELCDNIAASEGYIRSDSAFDTPTTKLNDVLPTATKRPPSRCDPSSFKDDQSLDTIFERVFHVLDAMQIFAQNDALKESCSSKWIENLQICFKISKLISNNEKSTVLAGKIESICESLKIESESETCECKFEKFKSDDELYILRNGLPGYKEALDKILSSIGGHEWNTKVLDVLEQRASMIDNFDQMKLLVDVLHSASIMIDMRIQSSLYSIFKTAFHNQKFSLRKEVMNYYYQKYQLWNSSESDPQYGTELNSIINSLAEHSSKGILRQLAVRLSWHFMLSAKNCWWRLLNAIISMPKLTQALVDILKHLPVVSSLKIPESGERLLFAGLKRLLEQNCLKNEDNETAWANFCVNLCNGAPKKPVYEPALLIREFLLPLLPAYPWILLPCFHKLLNDKTVIVHFRYPLVVVKRSVASNTENEERKTEENSESAISEDVTVVQKEEIVGHDAEKKEAVEVIKDGDTQQAYVCETIIDENVELVDPLTFFAKIFEIYVRATRDGHSETAQNLKVRTMCLKLFSILTDVWRQTAEKENRPFLLDSERIDEVLNEYSALSWAKRFYLRHLLQEFRQVSDGASPKVSDLINIPGCLFDKLDLPATNYSRDDCCEMDQSDPLTVSKIHPAICALKSFIESALISTDLCRKLLNDAPNFAYFTKFLGDDFRKFLSRATYEQLRGKGIEDFRSGIACLKEIFDHMETEKRKNGLSFDDPFVEGFQKGLKYAAPISIYCDVAMILIQQCRESDDDTPKLKQWLLCLCTVVNESCTGLTSSASFFDQMTTFSAMRQILANAVKVFEDFFALGSNDDRMRQKMELLLMSLYDNFRRADFLCDEILLAPILPLMSKNMSDTFKRKFGQQKAEEVQRQKC